MSRATIYAIAGASLFTITGSALLLRFDIAIRYQWRARRRARQITISGPVPRWPDLSKRDTRGGK